MKLGVTAYIWTAEFDRSHLSLLPLIKERGFDGLEFPLFRPRGFPAAEIRSAFRANGLECSVAAILVDNLSLISDDAAVRSEALNHLKEVVAAAAESGAKVIAGPVYSPVGYLPGRRRTRNEWQWAVEGFQKLGPTLAEHGVTLAIEPLNRFETYFLNTAADAAQLCDEVGHPNVGVLFDTFHANIEEKNIAGGYRTIGRHLKHVHLAENDRGTPGSGHIDWKSVFQAIRDVGYDGWMNIEGFGFTLGDLSAAASIWRDIEPSPENIAFDGIGFVKRSLQ